MRRTGIAARVIACVALASPSAAATFLVDVTLDRVDVLPGDGICADSLGACTLRAAIQETNALAGPDSITLPAGVFALTIGASREDASATGDLDVMDALTLEGAGRGATSIDAQLLDDPATGEGDRILDIRAGASLSLRGLTLTGGEAWDDGGALRVVDASLDVADVALVNNLVFPQVAQDGGGAVFASDSTLVLRDVEILENICLNLRGGGEDGRGGGISADRSDVSLVGVNVLDNSARHGGGIFINGGSLELRDVTVGDNAASSGGGGGGLAMLATPPALPPVASIERSTFIRNHGTDGGAIALVHGRLTLRNTTLARNRSSTGGGLLAGTGCVVDLFNVTIAGNVAYDGGGVQAVPGSVVSVANSIIGDNGPSRGVGTGPDWFGELDSLGHVLIEDSLDTSIIGDLTGVIVGQDPSLGPPADHGGSTETIALRFNSPAIDAGNALAPGSGDPACEATDQRLLARPFGATCDLGAYESDCFDPVDSDGDGGGDACDLCPTVADPDQRDFDEDGIGDACDCDLENDSINSDIPGLAVPCVPNGPNGTYDNCPWDENRGQGDRDVDGIGDDCDDCPRNADPAQEDVDGDGTGDACDNCPSDANPTQSDLDSDRMGDACDSCPLDRDPGGSDRDGDGIGDACDECTDTDGDGFGDPGFLPARTCPLDNCGQVANPAQEDADGDLVGDACDNCPFAADPAEVDIDRDGLGDACDACTDTDGDGFGDPGYPATTCTIDNCPEIENPGQENADGDALGDACEDCREPSAMDRDPSAAPLRVTKTGGVWFLRLEWQDISEHGYDVYRGTIPDTQSMAARAVPYDHDASWACNVADAWTVTPVGSENAYFLIATHCTGDVVSLGRDSLGREIPAGFNPCP